MTFKELRGALKSSVTLVLKFGETQTAAQVMSDCDEVLRGIEDYEVLDIVPHAYELEVVLNKPKEAKK